jgi:hypothetical protein
VPTLPRPYPPAASRARRYATVALVLAAALCGPAIATAALLPPAGPWPTSVDASNPLIGTPYGLNGGYATSDASLRAWFALGHHHYSTLSRPAGYTSLVEGTLHALPSGHPINGAELVVVAQTLAQPTWTTLTYAQADPHGRFRVRLPPSSSRRVAVLYWPSINSPAPVYSRRLLDRTTARVTLRAHVHGARVHFVGSVADAPSFSPCLLVALQVRNELGAWVTAAIAHARTRGVFGAAYTFQPGTYAVRAFVPEQAALPYFPGASPVHFVTAR